MKKHEEVLSVEEQVEIKYLIMSILDKYIKDWPKIPIGAGFLCKSDFAHICAENIRHFLAKGKK